MSRRSRCQGGSEEDPGDDDVGDDDMLMTTGMIRRKRRKRRKKRKMLRWRSRMSFCCTFSFTSHSQNTSSRKSNYFSNVTYGTLRTQSARK